MHSLTRIGRTRAGGQNNVEYWLVLESVKEGKAKTEKLLFYVAQQSTSVRLMCTLKASVHRARGPVFHEKTPK